MEAIRYYKRYIVENKNLVLITIIIALIFRGCVYLIHTDPLTYSYTPGYLWSTAIDNFLVEHRNISALIAILFTAIIAFYSGYLNNKHKLIRSRTYLVYVFCILFFSSHPVYIYMSPQYVSTLLLIISTDILLGSFQRTDSSGKAYSIGFLIASASLFTPSALIYIPVFWIGFRVMRCFKIKAIVTSLLGIISVYWIIFFYYLWQQDLNSFLEPLEQLYPIFSNYIKDISIASIIILAFCLILLMIAMVSYFNNSYKDKIQTRANLYFFYMIALFSLLSFLFINNTPTLYLYIFAFSCSLLFSHFFSLILEKWKVTFFYLSITLYLIISIYFLFSSTIIDLLTV